MAYKNVEKHTFLFSGIIKLNEGLPKETRQGIQGNAIGKRC